MARRDNTIANLRDVFVTIPWWVPLPLAVLVYTMVRCIPMAMVAQHDRMRPILEMIFAKLAWLPTAVILIAWLLSMIKRAARQRLLDQQSSLQSLHALHWQDFERLLSEAFRRQGYQVCELGGPQPDGGVDIILQKDGQRCFVQCKHWKTTHVGVNVIRELYGVMASAGVGQGIVVTSGKFSQAASDFARGKALQLIDGPQLLMLIQDVQSPGTRYIHTLKAQTTPQETYTDQFPGCPRCGAAMVMRTAKRGGHVGSQFWGCSRYPDCRGIRNCE